VTDTTGDDVCFCSAQKRLTLISNVWGNAHLAGIAGGQGSWVDRTAHDLEHEREAETK